VLTTLSVSTPAIGVPSASAITSTDLFLSEYIEGSSNNKALEVFNGTGASISLSAGGYNVQMFFNGGTTAGLTIDLSGTVPDGDVFVLAHSSAGPDILAQADQTNGAGWFNGDDAVVLRKGTTVLDVVGQVGFDPGSEWGSGLVSTADNTLRRKDTIAAGDTNPSDAFDPATGWDGFATDTFTGLGAHPGLPMPPEPDPVCGDPETFIHDIQGSGAASPLEGTVVEIEGVLTGDFQGSGALNGFFVQEEDGDADSDLATSEGIFVFAPAAPEVAVGDKVRVRGTVDEFSTKTELTSVTDVVACAQGATLPAPTSVSLPVGSLEEFETLEGMYVTFPQTLSISEYFNFDRFGEIVLTNGRQFQPTAVVEPGAPAQGLAQANLLNRITLDDGRNSQNPDPALHPNGATFDLANLFRGGDTVEGVTGVLDFAFGLYRVQPTQGADYTAANPRPAEPEDEGGNVKVASFNVLNYFTTIDTGADICGPAENLECRGADTAEEFERQRTKIISAITGLDADVVGLIELENQLTDSPTADLVSGLNDLAGPGTYDYIETGAIGTDAIRVAFIYKPASVTPLGDHAILDSTVDPRFDDDLNRPALAQTFQTNDTGGVFTAVVNHLKSKGSACPGDPDTGDGQGNCNLTRTAAAEALVDWLASDPTGSGDPDVLVIGDLNSYAKEDPIDVFRNAGGYTDLVQLFGGEFAYSFVFDGQLGYLDHALAGQALLDQVAGTTIWHINADEPDLIDYDTSFKQPAQDALFEPNAYRSSDHDPVLVGLDLCDEVAPTLDVMVNPSTLWPANHQYVRVEATVDAEDNFDPSPTVELVSVTSNEPDNGADDGNTVNDIVIVDDTTFQLRAERSGVGFGRIYTITYRATDDCGNSTVSSATVRVPLGQNG
jgi:hypothetical protein